MMCREITKTDRNGQTNPISELIFATLRGPMELEQIIRQHLQMVNMISGKAIKKIGVRR